MVIHILAYFKMNLIKHTTKCDKQKWGRFWGHREADQTSMDLCQFIPTWNIEWLRIVKMNGLRINDTTCTMIGLIRLDRVSSVKRKVKELR